MSHCLPIYAFDTNASDADQQLKAERSRLLINERRPLYCHLCYQLVCFKSEATTVAGQHEHVFTNPAGIDYHIACYENATGCNALGSPSVEHTWFSGYEWQIAVCISCSEHLGWLFTGKSHFFGLICDRLLDESVR